MFNFLVTAEEGAWDRPSYAFDGGRFLEYTDEEVKVRLASIDEVSEELLTQFPTLFAYETPVGRPARVGRLKTIRKRAREVAFTFAFDPSVPPIGANQLEALGARFGIGTFEWNRTHFAVKQGDLIGALAEVGVAGGDAAPPRSEPQTIRAPASPDRQQSARKARKVFLVHGRDAGAKNEVARYLERLGLEVTILHERPNGGRTLISKFRDEAADTGFAVVLMTPDDAGGLAGDAKLRPRARQNVVFELGYFIGQLGPDKVCALVVGDVERPSDFEAVVFEELDPRGAWKLALARELQAAGMPVDTSKML